MHDPEEDPPCAHLLLQGTFFEEQPQCWQNMVLTLRARDPYFNSAFTGSINRYLEQWNLTYEKSGLPGTSQITGKQSDLVAWMLAHG